MAEGGKYSARGITLKQVFGQAELAERNRKE
jgi:hypothetical protein